MKKRLGWILGLYLMYGLWAVWYILWGADTSLPEGLKGTTADPLTFLSNEKIDKINTYSDVKNILYLVTLPLEWFIFGGMLLLGFPSKLEKWVMSFSRFKLIQFPIFLFFFFVCVTIVKLPIELLNYFISKSFGLLTQSLHNWIRENIIDFWVNYGFMVIIFGTVYYLLFKHPKRWWLYSWLLSVPFLLFIMFIQPVVIDPLYNDFTPIYNKELEKKILTLAEEANIPASRVYQVDMSEKTNTLNAYVTGIGSNARIVLWDTTLQQLSEKEILFIMAHEMAHYVKKHIYYGVAVSLVIMFGGLWIVSRTLAYAQKKNLFNLFKEGRISFASLPLILLTFSVISILAEPGMNVLSRYEERVSDKYALELTQDSQSATTTFQSLTRNALSELNPPSVIKFFRYSHPTMIERLSYIEQWRKEKGK